MEDITQRAIKKLKKQGENEEKKKNIHTKQPKHIKISATHNRQKIFLKNKKPII